jgi:hypothetical protein
MRGRARESGNGIRWTLRQLAFRLARLRQPVRCFDSIHPISGRRLRVLHVGNPRRGRYFIEALYDEEIEGRLRGHTLVGVGVPARRDRVPACDIELVEISRLSDRQFARAGYLVIPEWVEFGRAVVTSEDQRYARASKSLKSDLQAVRRADFETSVSRDVKDFELFYREMYLPFSRARFGDSLIEKSRRRLLRDFRSGFLLLLRRGVQPLAGGIVRVDGAHVDLTTIGVWRGSDEILRSRVSAVIDYHLHDWAAANAKSYIGVGHTRPFPRDGVYFNKRKWMMEIEPDRDGVMAMALRWHAPEELLVDVFKELPLVYYATRGLGVFCVHAPGRTMQYNEARKLVRRYWTAGMSNLIAVCPNGFSPSVVDQVREECGSGVHLCTDFPTALRAYQGAA